MGVLLFVLFLSLLSHSLYLCTLVPSLSSSLHTSQPSLSPRTHPFVHSTTSHFLKLNLHHRHIRHRHYHHHLQRQTKWTQMATLTTTAASVRSHPEVRLLNRPAVIEYKHMRFLVSDAPADSNLPLYITEFETHRARNVVRVCDPTYGTSALDKLGIKVFDWPFGDGEAPPPLITRDWLHLVNTVFGKDDQQQPKESIAIHCVAGLGRAPLLVAIAFVEAGLSPEESIARVREKRRGALNAKQSKFILDYKRKKSRKSKCTIL